MRKSNAPTGVRQSAGTDMPCIGSLSLSQYAPKMEQIGERINGCAMLIEALATDSVAGFGFTEADACAARQICRRLREYAGCWRVMARHVHTPWLKLDQTDLDAASAAYARELVIGTTMAPDEVGGLLDGHADFLEPCRILFLKIASNYADHEADTAEARTHSAAFFIEGEIDRLMIDIAPLANGLYAAWLELRGAALQEVA